MIVKKIGRFGKPGYEVNRDLAYCDFTLTPPPFFRPHFRPLALTTASTKKTNSQQWKKSHQS
jgi:hypothetical protein